MKYNKRTNCYKNSTGTNFVYLNEDGSLKYATSYGWYIYAKAFKKGGYNINILNISTYSPTTVRHVYQCRDIINESDWDLILDDVPESLDNLPSIIKELERQAAELVEMTKQPRTHKSTNKSRLDKADRLLNQASYLKQLTTME